MTEGSHQPVMVEEVVRMLGDAELVVDMTLGAGGHTAALLHAGVACLPRLEAEDVSVLDRYPYLRRFQPWQNEWAEAYQAAGNNAEAKKLYEQIQKEAPQSEAAEFAKSKLQEIK